MTKHLAGWTAAAAAMVLAAASAAQAGRLPDFGNDVALLRPLNVMTYHERFECDEPAVVRVVGDGSTRLEVDVYDQNGNLIDSDVGYSCVVSWTPAWTGRFTIKVTNLGFDANAYVLKTN